MDLCNLKEVAQGLMQIREGAGLSAADSGVISR